jgi:hypothetical protein
MNHAKILPGHFRGLPTIRMRHNRASNVIADILLEDETIGDLVDGLLELEPILEFDHGSYQVYDDNGNFLATN